MIPPMKLKLGTTSMGSSHQAQETCSRDTNSFLSLETDVPHSGQNTASLRIAARQALQEYKGFAQYWQKLASGVFLPHDSMSILLAYFAIDLLWYYTNLD